ncbi:MAG: Bax inhibitor-1/YccA family membrane protein, partial [Actinomycetota bacterium]
MSKQVLNENTFSAAHTQELTGGRAVTKSMTYGGTIVRSLFLVVITLGFAAIGWQWAARVATTSGMWFFLGYILLIALTFAAVNNPRIAAVAGIVYAALMGTWMGSISRIYEAYYQGIVGQALLTTVCVFISCLFLYSFRVVRVTGRFVRVLFIALVGISFVYLFGWFVSIFGVRLNFLYNGSTTGIAISVVISIV